MRTAETPTRTRRRAGPHPQPGGRGQEDGRAITNHLTNRLEAGASRHLTRTLRTIRRRGAVQKIRHDRRDQMFEQ